MRERNEPQENWARTYRASVDLFPPESFHFTPDRFLALADPEWWSSAERNNLLPIGHRDKYLRAIHRFQEIVRTGYIATERTVDLVLPSDKSIYEDILSQVFPPLPRRPKIESVEKLYGEDFKRWNGGF